MNGDLADEDKYKYGTKRKGDEEWRKYQKDLEKKKLFEHMRDGVARRNRSMLESSLTEWQEQGYEESKLTNQAQFMLDIIKQKEELRKAIKASDKEFLQQRIEDINQASDPKIKRELQQSVIEAKAIVDKLLKRENGSQKVRTMEKKTLLELRKYAVPTKRVHRVLQASLLLLGYDEITSSNWTTCRKLLSPELLTAIEEIKISKLNPGIVATARYILHDELYDLKSRMTVGEMYSVHGENYQPDKNYQLQYWTTNDLVSVQEASPAAAVFCVWAMGIIDQFQDGRDDDDELSPVSPKEQQKILGIKFKDPHDMNQLSPQGTRKQYPAMAGRYLQRQ